MTTSDRDGEINLDRVLAYLALLNALVIVALFASAILAGISQEPFQIARQPGLNVERLLYNPAGLRVNVGLDNFFIVLYCSFFVAFATRLRQVMNPMPVAIALGAILLSGLLDAFENHHILVMLFSAEQKIPISAEQTQLQMILSSVKFHVSYVGMALFGFGFVKLRGLGRSIGLALWCFYIPLGMAIFITPVEMVKPLIIIRTFFFIGAFAATSLLFFRRARSAI